MGGHAGGQVGSQADRWWALKEFISIKTEVLRLFSLLPYLERQWLSSA